MHTNIFNKGKLKLFNTADSDLAARIIILENNVYKITYYEIISGANGSLTIPTAATINSYEFSGANCILSEIDVNNKPTWVSPKDAGGTVVTATLNTSTGAWVKSAVTVSANVALIYSINIAAKDYANLTNFYIIDQVIIGDFSYVLNNTTTASVSSSLLASAMSDETGSGALVFGTSPTFTTDITTPLIKSVSNAIVISNSNSDITYMGNYNHAFTNVLMYAAANANGYAITRITATTTSPCYVINRADTTTGIGGTINTVALIAGGASIFTVNNSGNIICGTAAITITATNGFLYVPSCAGIPTGTPTTVTGRIPIVVDSTNNKMYIYSGGAWVALN